MSELGNLAIVCASRMDVLLQIYDGYACVYVGKGTNRAHLIAKCNDNNQIKNIIHELNFGKFSEEKKYESAKRAA